MSEHHRQAVLWVCAHDHLGAVNLSQHWRRQDVVGRALGRSERGITVRGMDDIMITLAKCCNPVRGEQIIGYISRGKGVSVHSVACPNVAQLMYDSDRKIEVEWGVGEDGSRHFDIKLILEVEDRQGLLAKIVSAISDEKTNIKNVEAQTDESPEAKISLVLGVVEAFGTIYIGTLLDRDAIAFAFLIAVLMIRPQGLFAGK